MVVTIVFDLIAPIGILEIWNIDKNLHIRRPYD